MSNKQGKELNDNNNIDNNEHYKPLSKMTTKIFIIKLNLYYIYVTNTGLATAKKQLIFPCKIT